MAGESEASNRLRTPAAAVPASIDIRGRIYAPFHSNEMTEA